MAKALVYFPNKRRKTLSNVGLHGFANIVRALDQSDPIAEVHLRNTRQHGILTGNSNSDSRTVQHIACVLADRIVLVSLLNRVTKDRDLLALGYRLVLGQFTNFASGTHNDKFHYPIF